MTIAALIVAVLKVISGLLGFVDKRTLAKLGADAALKDVLVEILRRVGIAHEVAAEVAGLSDDAVADRLQKYGRTDTGQLLPGVGSNNLPGVGTASSQKST